MLRYFLVLKYLDFTLIFHQIVSYHEKNSFDNLPFLCFKTHFNYRNWWTSLASASQTF